MDEALPSKSVGSFLSKVHHHIAKGTNLQIP